VLATARVWAQGFALAAVLGVAAGLGMAFLPPVRAMFALIIELLRPMPSVAILPIAILLLGLGDAMKVAVIAYAAVWPILLNSLYGVQGVEACLIDVARTFHLGWWRTVSRILLPAAAPMIATGLRVSSGIALILAVTADLVAGQSGLGSFIVQAQLAVRTAEMYAGILTVAVLGYALNALLVTAEGHLLAWHRGATAKEAA
jgi:ABC-type nitrate/sulfonate/bicarbonate transport system permease component